MLTPDRKVRKLMKDYQVSHNLSKCALNADMDVKTARKYLRADKLPSQTYTEHTWKTRVDPFEEDWSFCESILEVAPEVEAKTLFDTLCSKSPDRYQEGQLRTLQRKIRKWRAHKGPDQEVFFPQIHYPGKRMSTDCTHANELNITINNEPFPHLFCHCVLTFSNWQWATICHSESLLALRQGIQAALFQLGATPREHWTDHSSAATHVPPAAEGQDRRFNQGYLDIMSHFGMEPHTIQVNSPNENGDVESLNRVLKSRLKQYLIMRGSRDFKSIEAYKHFLEEALHKANSLRSERLQEELQEMAVLKVSKLAEYEKYICSVRSSSTITIKRRVYSLPSRLIGRKVIVHQYEDRIKVIHNNVLQLVAPWLGRDSGSIIDYRHIIGSLVRKPGAFRNYRFREELFPSATFRWAWECLSYNLSNRTAEREYLQLLNRAAKTMESEVESALSALRNEGKIPRLDEVLLKCSPTEYEIPRLKPLVVKLEEYNELFTGREEMA